MDDSQACSKSAGHWPPSRIAINKDLWMLMLKMAMDGHSVYKKEMSILVPKWMKLICNEQAHQMLELSDHESMLLKERADAEERVTQKLSARIGGSSMVQQQQKRTRRTIAQLQVDDFNSMNVQWVDSSDWVQDAVEEVICEKKKYLEAVCKSPAYLCKISDKSGTDFSKSYEPYEYFFCFS